jgi:hypothetical protein
LLGSVWDRDSNAGWLRRIPCIILLDRKKRLQNVVSDRLMAQKEFEQAINSLLKFVDRPYTGSAAD